MRPIPAPRLGDAHGLLRAIGERDRLRLDEFVTEFSVSDLFPPGLENALGRTRQFISFARSAGLLNEDRGTVELTDMGKRYVRAGDSERPFDVAAVNAFLHCRDELVAAMDPRDAAAMLGLLAEEPLTRIAEAEGVSVSALSQRAIRGGLYAIRRAHLELREAVA